MIRHHLARMTHDNAAAQHHDLDALPDQPPGNRVTVRVQVDCAVRLDLAHEVPQLPKRRPSAERAKRPGLFGKALGRSHAGRAMHTLIGNLARPPVQMRLERRPVLEPAAGDRIALDVADPAFVLPLRTRPVGRTGPRRKSPVAGKGVQPRVEPHLPRRRIVMVDQRLRIVEQHFRWNPAEAKESSFHPLEPVRLALPKRGTDMQPTRVTQRCHKQVRPSTLAADPHPRVAKVDLHLISRRRLKPNRRALLRLQLPTPMLHPKLHRTKPNDDPMFARQFLAHHIGVAAMAEEALPQPIVQPVKRGPPHRFAKPLAQIPTHRVARVPEFLRQSLRSPAKLMQPQHRCHLFRLKHLLSLHRSRQCRNRRNPNRHPCLLSTEGVSSSFR